MYKKQIINDCGVLEEYNGIKFKRNDGSIFVDMVKKIDIS